jgi:hypothetical protein
MSNITNLKLLLLQIFIFNGVRMSGGNGEASSGKKTQINEEPSSHSKMIPDGTSVTQNEGSLRKSQKLNSVQSKFLSNGQLGEFLEIGQKSSRITAKIPFSVFANIFERFLKALNTVVSHPSYDINWDENFVGLVVNMEDLYTEAIPDVLQIKNNLVLIYKFLNENVKAMKQNVKNLIKFESKMLKNKLIIDETKNLFLILKELNSQLSKLKEIDSFHYEITPFIIENKKTFTISREDGLRMMRKMVYSMVTLNSVIENSYNYKIPLQEMSIFSNLVVVFVSIFQKIIESKSIALIENAYEVLDRFFALEQNESLYLVSEVNKNKNFVFKIDKRNELARVLNDTSMIFKAHCLHKVSDPHCMMANSHLEKLFNKLENHIFETINGMGEDVIFTQRINKKSNSSSPPQEDFSKEMTEVNNELKNPDSYFFKNFPSNFSVYSRTAINFGSFIIDEYEQNSYFMEMYIKLSENIKIMLESSFIRKYKNSIGKIERSIVYPKEICLEVRNNTENFLSMFGSSVLIDKNDKNTIGFFYSSIAALVEMIRMYRNEFNYSDEYCSEKYNGSIDESEPLNALIKQTSLPGSVSELSKEISYIQNPLDSQFNIDAHEVKEKNMELSNKDSLDDKLMKKRRNMKNSTNENGWFKLTRVNEPTACIQGDSSSPVMVDEKKKNILIKIILIEIISCGRCLDKSGFFEYASSSIPSETILYSKVTFGFI